MRWYPGLLPLPAAAIALVRLLCLSLHFPNEIGSKADQTPMKTKLLYLTVFVLYLLHNDLWGWTDARGGLGVPVGLLYHVGYCLAAAVLMILLVTYAWPHHLEVHEEDT